MESSSRVTEPGESDQPSTIRCIVAALRENFALLVAGSIAYSAFMSVLPLLTLSFVAASILGGPQLIEQAVQFSGKFLTPSGQDLFVQAMQNRSGRAATSLVSLLVLLWSSLRVFRTLDTSFSLFYNTTGQKSIVEQTRDTLLVLVAFAVALVATVGIGVASAFLSIVPMGWLVWPVVLVLPLAASFVPIYYVFPDVDVTLREVLPGALFAAIGWALLHTGFQQYLQYASGSEVYGTLGAVLLVLTWLYLAGLLLLVGVAVNVVFADRTRAALAPPPSRTNVVVGR